VKVLCKKQTTLGITRRDHTSSGVAYLGLTAPWDKLSLGAPTQPGAELGGCQGGPLPPKILPDPPSRPPKIFRVTSCHCIEII